MNYERKYEKPKLTFSNLTVEKSVAATCWGLHPGHPHDVEHFYDVEGTGYIGFHIQSSSGNCGGPDAYSILYYESEGSVGDPVKGAEYESFIESELTKRGGNNGQPYNNISTDFPTNPNPGWS